MNFKKGCLFLFSLILISACKIDMNTDIYLRDIKDVALINSEGLHTSGLLKVGVPNCKNKEKLSEVTGLLKDYFLNVSEKTCEAGMESLLTIGVDIPIINSTQGWTSKTSSTTALVTNKSKDGSSILVSFELNKTKFANLNSAVQNKFFDKLSFDESTVSFSVNNDSRQDEVAVISDSFVDGKPIIHSKRFTLARRNKIDVEPSNVRRITFSNNGSMPVLEIPIVDSEKATLDEEKNIEVVKDNSSKTQGLNSQQLLNYNANEKFYKWFFVQKSAHPELNTNQLIWSKNFVSFIKRNLVSKQKYYLGMTKGREKETLSYHLLEVLGGPPEKVSEKNGVINISGCRAHSCEEKGFVWIDTQLNKQIFIINHYFYNNSQYLPEGNLLIFSNDFSTTSELPKQFETDSLTWLKDNKIETVLVRHFFS